MDMYATWLLSSLYRLTPSQQDWKWTCALSPLMQFVSFIPGCLGGRVSLEASGGDAVSDWADILVGQVLGVVGAGSGVAGEQAEALGEGFDVCGVGAVAFVIDCHALVGDFIEGAIRVVVVELGGSSRRICLFGFRRRCS